MIHSLFDPFYACLKSIWKSIFAAYQYHFLNWFLLQAFIFSKLVCFSEETAGDWREASLLLEYIYSIGDEI